MSREGRIRRVIGIRSTIHGSDATSSSYGGGMCDGAGGGGCMCTSGSSISKCGGRRSRSDIVRRSMGISSSNGSLIRSSGSRSRVGSSGRGMSPSRRMRRCGSKSSGDRGGGGTASSATGAGGTSSGSGLSFLDHLINLDSIVKIVFGCLNAITYSRVLRTLVFVQHKTVGSTPYRKSLKNNLMNLSDNTHFTCSEFIIMPDYCAACL